MPQFLADPPLTVYLVLAAVAVVAGLVWLSRRTRRTFGVFLAVLTVAVAVGLIDLLFESPREAAVRGVRELSKAINARDWDRFDSRVSKEFEYKGLKKADLRNKMAGVIGMFDARTAVWDFDRDKVTQIGDDQVSVVFDAKGDPKSGAAYYTHLKATFVREADGEWRLKTIAVYSYVSKSEGPEEAIPGIP